MSGAADRRAVVGWLARREFRWQCGVSSCHRSYMIVLSHGWLVFAEATTESVEQQIVAWGRLVGQQA